MNEKKVSKSRQKKEALVSELSEKTQKARALVFTNYQGLTHKQLEELKKALKGVNAELVVAKNTLLKLALDKNQKSSIRQAQDKNQKELEGPTAAVFVYEDIMGPLKEIAKTIKQFSLPTLKFGILEGLVLTGDELLKLAALPSKEILLAQVVYGLKSPIFGLHRALSWNLQKLAMTLKAIENSKK